MTSYRNSARIVGILFLVSYVGFGIGTALMAPITDASADLATFYPDRAPLIAGALLEFLNVAAIIGIALLLFPHLKRVGEGAALAYVAFRTLEGAIYLVDKIFALSLVTLSEEYLKAGSSESGYFETAHAMTLGQRHWANVMIVVAFIVGASILYSLLYRSELVPRFIAVWGLVAVAMLAAGNLIVPDMSGGFELAWLLFLPIVTNELFLAGWLIFKGFNRALANDGMVIEA